MSARAREPLLAEEIAQRLIAMYARLEQQLAAGIAARVAAGTGAPDWAAQKLAAVREVERWANALVARLTGSMRDEVARALLAAYRAGGNQALIELSGMRAHLSDPHLLDAALEEAALLAKVTSVERALPGAHAINRLLIELVTGMNATGPRITRWAIDAYREVVAAGAAVDVLAGTRTRYVATQAAWNALLDRGITGFVDRAGRPWSLSGYVEMATRTTVARAATAGRLDRLATAGIDYVLVSNHAHECALCRPWEQRILARAGAAGKRTVETTNAVTGERSRFECAGTVDEAMRAGLLHPNCEHGLNPYVHGAVRVQSGTADPQGDVARQRQRAIERRIRRAKTRADAVIDPTQRRAALVRVRSTQAELREHLRASNAAGLGLLRRSYRERPDLGFTRK